MAISVIRKPHGGNVLQTFSAFAINNNMITALHTSKVPHWFFLTSSILLCFTACAKLFTAAGSMKILHLKDPVLSINYRVLFFCAAGVELLVAAYLLRATSDIKKAVVLLWLTGNFVAYRMGNHFFGESHCKCLGTLTDRVPGGEKTAAIFLIGCLFLFTAGSVYILIASRVSIHPRPE